MKTPSEAFTAGPTTPRPAFPRRRVRVVGNVRACLASSSGNASSSDPCGVPRVSILKSEAGTSSHATVVLGAGQSDGSSRRESYKLDWCYDQHEDVDVLFQNEVKPLIEGAFQGADATVIAFGCQGTGKTQLIEGSEENPGLASLALADILALCEETSCSVQLSYYEVHHDHVLDLIEKKEQGVQVLEDASGRIQLKGLSQVQIESVSEFSKLFLHDIKQKKSSQKNATDAITRSHKGLIIYISYCGNNNSVLCCKGRMNFIDLAGYEDIKKISSNRQLLVETVRINKSLYALTNLLGALNRNETRVPYRDSKLTHLLKGSLIKENSQTLMITCLNPKPCQEAFQALSMASQSCLVTNPIRLESIVANHSRQIPPQACSPLGSRSLSSSASFNKAGISRLGLLDKKPGGASPVTRGRRLFNIKSPFTKSLQDQTSSHTASGGKTQEQYETTDKLLQGNTWGFGILEQTCAEEKIKPFSDATIIIPVAQETESFPMLSPATSSLYQEEVISANDTRILSKHESLNAKGWEQGSEGSIEQSNWTTSNIKVTTPPLSEKLREITNSLKALSCQKSDQVEPKTPGVLFNIKFNEDIDMCSTQQQLLKSRSTRLKKTLVQELLNYINNANKDELQQLKGIGNKRAAYIVDLREEIPFKDMNDLKKLGVNSKQAKEMIKDLLEL